MDETSRDKGKRAAGNPAREPRTIDLSPSEIVEETAPVASHAAEVKAGDEAAPPREQAPREQAGTPGRDDVRRKRRPLLAWVPSLTSPVASAVLGGIVGALLVIAGWWLLKPRDTIVTRLAKLERTLDQALLDAARRADVEAVDNRIRDVASGLKAANDRLAAVSTKADDAARRLAAAPAGSQAGGGVAAADVTEVRQRLEALETTLKGFDPGAAQAARQSADKTAALTAALDGRVRGLEKNGAGPSVNRGVAMLMLQRAVESGKPYQAELAAMKAAGGDPAVLAALERSAASGMPSVNSLTRDFGKLADRVLAESAPAPADEGWLDRMMRSAQRVVRIRPADETTGANPPAVVARIETALKRRDLAAAAAAWDSLPDGGRQASREWGERLKGRIATEAALQKLTADGLAGLARQEIPVR